MNPGHLFSSVLKCLLFGSLTQVNCGSFPILTDSDIQEFYANRKYHGKVYVAFWDVKTKTFSNQGNPDKDQKKEGQHFDRWISIDKFTDSKRINIAAVSVFMIIATNTEGKNDAVLKVLFIIEQSSRETRSGFEISQKYELISAGLKRDFHRANSRRSRPAIPFDTDH